MLRGPCSCARVVPVGRCGCGSRASGGSAPRGWPCMARTMLERMAWLPVLSLLELRAVQAGIELHLHEGVLNEKEREGKLSHEVNSRKQTPHSTNPFAHVSIASFRMNAR
jgi:hypothetical protein